MFGVTNKQLTSLTKYFFTLYLFDRISIESMLFAIFEVYSCLIYNNTGELLKFYTPAASPIFNPALKNIFSGKGKLK